LISLQTNNALGQNRKPATLSATQAEFFKHHTAHGQEGRQSKAGLHAQQPQIWQGPEGLLAGAGATTPQAAAGSRLGGFYSILAVTDCLGFMP